MTSRNRFRYFAWALLAYNIPVVLWGAFVRASRSGDGCGEHWPTCGGEVVPTAVQHGKTWIEYGHRISTGVLLPIILIGLIWAFRAYAKGHRVRKAVCAVLFFTLTEGLIGRFLVVHKLVAMNTSGERVAWMALHLANIFLLLTALTLLVWWSSGGASVRLGGHGQLAKMWAACLLGIVAVAVTGSVSALGDTLYPVETLAEGIRQDFAHNAVLILKTRPLHPITAVLATAFTLWTITSTLRLRPVFWVRKLAVPVMMVMVGQFFFGFANLFMLAPIWAQMVHLLLANLLWIGLVLLAASALAQEETVQSAAENRSNEEVSRTWPEPIPLVS